MAGDELIAAPGRVPDSYLFAEVAAFPLTSEAAFRHHLIRLDPSLDDHTRALWRACEQTLADRANWSLDRLVALRDHTWFGSDEVRHGHAAAPSSMLHYLQRLARMYFAPTPGVTWPADPDAESMSMDGGERQRWIAFALPEDVLLGALKVEPAPDRIITDTPLLLRRLLDLGVAEIHQHLNAGMEFSLLWASTLTMLAGPQVRDDMLVGPGVAFGGGKYLIRWLLCAAVIRCVLAEFLVRHACGRARPSLRAFIRERLEPDSALTDAQQRTLYQVVVALESADDGELPALFALRDLYADLHPGARELLDDPLTSVEDAYRRCDPIAVRVGLAGRNCGERWLQREALAYLGAHGEDQAFELLYWQIVRIRCQLYRTIVERPLTAGLQWFIRFYNRIGHLKGPVEPILVEASYLAAGEGQPIAALEVRGTPADSPLVLADKLCGMLRSWGRVLARVGEQPAAPEFGVVLHFVKARDLPSTSAWERGVPAAFWSQTQADPIELRDLKSGRYLEFFSKQAATAQAIVELIEAVPTVLWLLRGLDIASDELGVPTWVFVPILAHVREAADIASRRLDVGMSLGVTAHVGEDFRHLLEGMRRVFEQVTYLLGPRGGRLGHAVALGLDPRAWAAAAGVVVMPAEERLWDLVFEWRLHTRYRVAAEFASEPPAGRIERVELELRKLSELVFADVKPPPPPPVLGELHHVLHRFLLPQPGQSSVVESGGLDCFNRALAALRADEDVREPDEVIPLLESYLQDAALFHRGQALVDVHTDSLELAGMLAVQAALRRGVGKRGIVVEVNPSSNLLIGDLADLRNHPIMRLCPPEREPGDLPPVAIAVGSDDPVTFSTWLLREYALLHQTARAAGYGERCVHAWLDAIRQTGMDARMTVAWRPSASDLAARLEGELERYARGRRVAADGGPRGSPQQPASPTTQPSAASTVR